MENVKKLILCMLMPVLVSTAAVADIHYVNPGESIQDAIDAADPGDEIEVAPGTYIEAINFNGKAVWLYSSGGPDVTTIDGTGYHHVVQCVSGEGSGTILEGFTITGGCANSINMWVDKVGGGMLNGNSSPTVTNCTFTGNTAELRGGGMCNYDNANPTVTDCTFTQNTSYGNGGGMYNESNSSPTVTNCTFSGNTAGRGGGMCNGHSSPTVTGCTFTGNTANDGGGMYNYDSSPTLTNCIFLNNTVALDGGGMYNRVSSPTLTNCTFSGNTANFGGGMYNFDSSPTVTNCTFTQNTSYGNGGGMTNNYASSPTVTNCTFTVNTASLGGGMYNLTSTPTLANCILWDDSPNEIFDEPDSSTTVTYSDVQGGWAGVGNLHICPLFSDADGRLLAFSPCIDAGNDAAVPPGVTTDLDGNPRIQGVCVDMGAFESEFIVIDFSGWVWMESDINFGYSLDEDDLLYFLSFGPVWYYNTATSQWGEEGPVGWVYVNWPFLYELDTSTMIFALPPESGLSVYHFRTGQWTVSPRIIP